MEKPKTSRQSVPTITSSSNNDAARREKISKYTRTAFVTGAIASTIVCLPIILMNNLLAVVVIPAYTILLLIFALLSFTLVRLVFGSTKQRLFALALLVIALPLAFAGYTKLKHSDSNRQEYCNGVAIKSTEPCNYLSD